MEVRREYQRIDEHISPKANGQIVPQSDDDIYNNTDTDKTPGTMETPGNDEPVPITADGDRKADNAAPASTTADGDNEGQAPTPNISDTPNISTAPDMGEPEPERGRSHRRALVKPRPHSTSGSISSYFRRRSPGSRTPVKRKKPSGTPEPPNIPEMKQSKGNPSTECSNGKTAIT